MYVVSSLSTLHNSRQHSTSEHTNIGRKKSPKRLLNLRFCEILGKTQITSSKYRIRLATNIRQRKVSSLLLVNELSFDEFADRQTNKHGDA